MKGKGLCPPWIDSGEMRNELLQREQWEQNSAEAKKKKRTITNIY